MMVRVVKREGLGGVQSHTPFVTRLATLIPFRRTHRGPGAHSRVRLMTMVRAGMDRDPSSNQEKPIVPPLEYRAAPQLLGTLMGVTEGAEKMEKTSQPADDSGVRVPDIVDVIVGVIDEVMVIVMDGVAVSDSQRIPLLLTATVAKVPPSSGML